VALTRASLDVSLVGRQGVTLANDTASLTAVVCAARAVVGAFCKQKSNVEVNGFNNLHKTDVTGM